MPPFDSLPLTAVAAAAAAVVLCLVLALLAWRLRKRRPAAGKPKAKARTDRPNSREGVDLLARYHPSAVRVLTAFEREAFDLVRAALPQHIVMAQVPLMRYLKVQDKRTEDDWLRGLSMLSADILVCDSSSRPVIAVEILPPNPGPRAQERHERMRQLLEGVGVRVLIWQEARLPAAEQARTQLQTALESAGSPGARQKTSRGDVPPVARRRGPASDAQPTAAAMRIEPELGPVDQPARGTGAARTAAPSAAPLRGTAAPPAGPTAARPAAPSGFAPLIPVPEIAELLAEGDEIAARHSSFDPVSLTFFDEFEARPQSPSAGAH